METLAAIFSGLLLTIGGWFNPVPEPQTLGVSTFNVQQGGTGVGTFTSSRLIYGNGTNALSSVATTSASCSGSATCDPFTVIGSSPVTISATAGGGSGTVSTSTNEVSGYLPYWTTTSGTPAKLGQVATTSVSCTGTASCTSFTAIGGSPVTITGSAGTSASSTLLSDQNTFSTIGTTTFNGNIVMTHPMFLTTHAVRGDSSDGIQITANNYTQVATFGVGNTANSLFLGGVNIDGQTRLATSLSGFVGANSGTLYNFATSTIFGVGTPGYVWSYQNGAAGWYATSSSAAGVTSVTATAPIFSSGGATPNITWAGLATTSQPSASNLLTSNGGAGVYGTATSTLSATAPLTGSFVQVGSGGALGCTTAASGVAGCLSNTAFDTFNGKESVLTFSTPLMRTTNNIAWVGLATTSQPTSSNLLVSNGGAGVFGVATTTASCSGSTSCTPFTVLGSAPITISSTGGGSFSWTPDTNYGALANSTSTPIWFKVGMQASSTSHFVQSSTTLATVSNTLYIGTDVGSASYIEALGDGEILITGDQSNGKGISVNGFGNDDIAIKSGSGRYYFYDAAGSVSADLDFTQIASTDKSFSFPNASGTLCITTTCIGTTTTAGLGNNLSLYTSASGVITGVATTTLYGPLGTPGQVLMSSNGRAVWAATSSAAAGVTSVTATAPLFSSGGATPNLTWSGLATTSQPTAGQMLFSNGTSGLVPVSTTTETFTGPFLRTAGAGYLVGGSNSTVTWTGLATTSQPAASNLLYSSNGGAGVAGVATSTLTATSPLTGSFVQIGSGGSLGCTTAASGVAGCLSNTSFDTFNNKQAAITATWPQILTAGALTFGWATTSQPSSSNLWVSNGTNGFYGVATTTRTFSGPFIASAGGGALVGGSNSTITWTGLATTSQPAISNLLVSNGGAGVFGVATTSVTCSGSISCSTFNVLGSSPITISGSGGSGNMSGWATSTTSWGQEIVYPVNGALDDVVFGRTGTGATSTAPFWWDVSATSTYIGNGGVGTSSMAFSGSSANPSSKWWNIGTYSSTQSGFGNFFIASSSAANNLTTLPYLTITQDGNIGVGSSTPWARLSVASSTSGVGLGTRPLFAVATGTQSLPNFMVDSVGHIMTSGPQPTVSVCGASPTITGNDTAGKVVTGGSNPTSCTVTFANAYPTAPSCTFGIASTTPYRFKGYTLMSSTTNTKFSFVASSTGAGGAIMNQETVNYICFGIQ